MKYHERKECKEEMEGREREGEREVGAKDKEVEQADKEEG
jgi:hypothetical protein